MTTGAVDKILSRVKKKLTRTKQLPEYKPQKVRTKPELTWNPERYKKGQQRKK